MFLFKILVALPSWQGVLCCVHFSLYQPTSLLIVNLTPNWNCGFRGSPLPDPLDLILLTSPLVSSLNPICTKSDYFLLTNHSCLFPNSGTDAPISSHAGLKPQSHFQFVSRHHLSHAISCPACSGIHVPSVFLFSLDPLFHPSLVQALIIF